MPARERAKLRYKMRVGQEAYVEYQIGILRKLILSFPYDRSRRDSDAFPDRAGQLFGPSDGAVHDGQAGGPCERQLDRSRLLRTRLLADGDQQR